MYLQDGKALEYLEDTAGALPQSIEAPSFIHQMVEGLDQDYEPTEIRITESLTVS